MARLRPQLLAVLCLALSACVAQAATCARPEWKNVYYSVRNNRLTNDNARNTMRLIVDAVAGQRSAQRSVGTVGCELATFQAVIACNDNSPVKSSPDRKAMWFVKYRAAYSCNSGFKYFTIWAFSTNPSDPSEVRVPHSRPTSRW